MTTLTDTQVITASGGLVELGYSQITSDIVCTGSISSPTEVIAPLTVVCDGGPVLVEFFSPGIRKSQTNAAETRVQLWMDGSKRIETLGYYYQPGSSFDSYSPAYHSARITPSAGSHTFGIKVSVSSGTADVAANTGSSSTLAPAFLRVSKIVQATQWPAVTTGTIICTSSTRPASPFEGQRIYQTDDKRELVYNGSAWVTTTPVGAYTVTTGTTTSTSYTATLTSGGTNPSVTLNTGTSALVSIGASSSNSSTVVGNWISVAVSGATTLAASDDNAALYDTSNANYLVSTSLTFVLTGLTAGSNTFALNYRTTGGTASFRRRSLVVQGLP